MKESTLLFRRLTAIATFVKNTPNLTSIPAIASILVTLENMLKRIEQLTSENDSEYKVASVALRATIQKVAGPLFNVVKALEFYYEKKDNPAMVAKLHTTRTSFLQLDSNEMNDCAASIIKVGRENLENLKQFNITEETFTGIEANVQTMMKEHLELEAQKLEKRKSSSEIDSVSDEAKNILSDLDKLVEMQSISNPEQWKEYQSIRNKKDSLESILTLSIINSVTRKPEENAHVILTSTTRKEKNLPYVLIDRKTGKRGEIRISKRQFDIYTITIEKIGRELYSKTVSISDNTPVHLDIFLNNKGN